jgi:hypothetical protein
MSLLKLSCALSGYDYKEVKNQNHKSKNRIVTYGVVMLIPMTLWFINGVILGTRLFELNFFVSLLFGTVLCLIIWVFERSIIQLDKNKYLSILRFTLGGLFALLGSFLLDEIIFQHDIHNEIMIIKKEERKRNLLDFDKQHEEKLNQINSSIHLADNWAKIKQTEATQEADGTGGTKSRGFEKVAQHKQQIADKEADKVKAMESDKKKLLANYESNRLAEESTFNKEFKENSILLNMRAMFQVISNSIGALLIWLIFTLILAAFEFLVIIIKMVSKPTDYEDYIELESNIKKSDLSSIWENKQRMLQAGLSPYYNNNKPNFQ